MFGEHGKSGKADWYGFTPRKYDHRAEDIWYWSMLDQDTELASPNLPWIGYIQGKNSGFPVGALRGDLARIRQRVQAMRADTTTPDTRLADDPMKFNPCSVRSLIHLMLGGMHPRHEGSILHCRVRYFDPIHRRAGIPDDVAALVENISHDGMTVRLVNVNQSDSRLVTLQAGAYGEHQFLTVSIGKKSASINAPLLNVRLAPGAGGLLTIKMKRYANQPTLMQPWDR